MADDGKTDWSKVHTTVQRAAHSEIIPLAASETLPTLNAPGDVGQEVTAPDGIIHKYKANKVAKRAAIAHLETWYASRLEVAKHHLTEVARVRKAESTMVADQFLRHLNAQNLEYLTTLGLANESVRSRALLALNDQTSETLKQIQTRDWPEPLIDSAIHGVLERQKKFMDKLINELGD